MSEENAYRKLGNAIILQAVDDWRCLCAKLKKPAQYPSNKISSAFASLRKFFKGEWCDLLCGNVNPALILKQLEHERQAALNEN